jgi:hypothetical protein
MEISDVKRQTLGAIERARRNAAARQARHDEQSRAYAEFLDKMAVPLMRQIANVLRTQGFPFTVFTPGGSVRLMSDKASDDYFELLLDSSGDDAVVMGHSSRARGRRVIESEQTVGAPSELTEEQLLDFVLRELEPFVEK